MSTLLLSRHSWNPMHLGRMGILAMLLAPLAVQAATQSYTLPGTYTWTVPPGVTSLDVTAIGGGGSGGVTGNAAGGAGGAGGVVTNTSWAVTPGQVINIVVGGGARLEGDAALVEGGEAARGRALA